MVGLEAVARLGCPHVRLDAPAIDAALRRGSLCGRGYPPKSFYPVPNSMMPPVPVPPDVDEFLRLPNPAVVASLRRDGTPHTVATWYAWEVDRVLLSMDESRLRLRFMRRDPRIALTVLDHEDWGRHVSLLGRVVSVEEDVGLRDIDRLALRYTGKPFRTRDRRRFSAWMQIESWHGWMGAHPWPAGSQFRPSRREVCEPASVSYRSR